MLIDKYQPLPQEIIPETEWLSDQQRESLLEASLSKTPRDIVFEALHIFSGAKTAGIRQGQFTNRVGATTKVTRTLSKAHDTIREMLTDITDIEFSREESEQRDKICGRVDYYTNEIKTGNSEFYEFTKNLILFTKYCIHRSKLIMEKKRMQAEFVLSNIYSMLETEAKEGKVDADAEVVKKMMEDLVAVVIEDDPYKQLYQAQDLIYELILGTINPSMSGSLASSAEVAGLRKQIESLTTDVSRSADLLKEKEETCREKEEEVRKLKEKLLLTRQEAQDAVAEQHSWEGKMQDLRNTIFSSESQIRSLEAQLQQKGENGNGDVNTEEYQRLMREKKLLEEEHNELLGKVKEEVETQVDKKLQATIDSHNKEKEALRSQLEELEKNQSVGGEGEVDQEEVERLKEKIALLEEKNEGLNKERQKLQQEFDGLVKRSQSFIAKMEGKIRN